MTRLVHTFAPRGGCLDLFERRDPEILLSGPAGTGKSRACLEKLHACMLVNPGAQALIVRKTAISLTTSAIKTYKNYVAKEALTAGLVSYYGGSKEEPAQYRYPGGAAIMLGGMDNPDRVMSTEYDIVYAQEARELTVTDWESLNSRLRNGVISFQQLIGDTNPDAPTHWLAERCNRATTAMVETRHVDNPRLFREMPAAEVSNSERLPTDVLRGRWLYRLTEYGTAYMARLHNLTGVRRLRLLDGKWVGAEGQIFDEFDAAIHMVDPFEIPDTWARYWAVDFGYVLAHPMVIQMWAEHPATGDLYRYREFFGTRRLVDEWAYAALDSVRVARVPNPDRAREADWVWTEPRPSVVVCDHDAEGRAKLESILGQSMRAADKRVTLGIDAVKVRLRDRRLFYVRGARVHADPELEAAHRPTCTEEEFPGYVWDERKEKPVKDMDDGMDTTRYLVMYRDMGGRSSVRF